jgi:3-oxoacyl-[acyl-carrier protein] reductase
VSSLPSESLTGRRALVTAASSGIGRATAALLVDRGADVFITGTSDRTAAAAQETGAAGYARADFTQPGAGTAAARAAIEHLGGVDILVVNTGGPKPASFDALTDEDWHVAYHLILASAIELTREALRRMGEGGRVIFLTSTAGTIKPLPTLHLSNVMRAAVAGLSTSLVSEYGPRGITFNVIALGPIDTGRHRQIMEVQAARRGRPVDEVEAAERERIPARRLGTPEEVAGLVAYLVSAEAGFITGRVHAIDGGLTLV